MKTVYKILLSIILLQTMACADLSYYMHSAQGQVSIMQKMQDIDDVMQDETTQATLKRQLKLVGSIRQFAFEQLSLPESDSYTQYADIGRPYVLKNLFASDEFSTSLQSWCYPIVGCAGYRGYFDENKLEQFKSTLLQQGKDVYVANIPAYSTLGWFDDPVLNTFISWPEYRLAGLMFHELAHQRLYIDNDSQFNESFAMAVQYSGVEKWLQDKGQFEKLKRYKQYQQNRLKVISLIDQGRLNLTQLYEQNLGDNEKRSQKKQLLAQLRIDYEELSSEFEVPGGFKYWFKGELNNAKLASVSTYLSRVKAFRKLLQSHAGNYDEFYLHVNEIGMLPVAERNSCLDLWGQTDTGSTSC